ncbi:PIN domain-containing protein [Granulicella rosea]|uniref:PIN domain-containing protein n=1 Tax=Granulicella rosea TaxID=474952 RepID=A0A239MLD8_9BACT|nr:PIN domain-containing protein [Granulicella rosea]SNT43526.1 PIN domain-containing protein [Granulicella rosea]
MTSGYQVVLDACVLVNAALRDTLLRIAEPPRLYLPRWSKSILEETTRTLEAKLGLSREQTSRLSEQLGIHFPDCWVEGYDELIPAMTNHPKDRHVLAAAVRTGAQTIVTFNLRDFSPEALAPWNIEAQTPDEFLVHQFHLDSATVVAKLQEQAAARGGMARLLEIHQKTAPAFTVLIRRHL